MTEHRESNGSLNSTVSRRAYIGGGYCRRGAVTRACHAHSRGSMCSCHSIVLLSSLAFSISLFRRLVFAERVEEAEKPMRLALTRETTAQCSGNTCVFERLIGHDALRRRKYSLSQRNETTRSSSVGESLSASCRNSETAGAS